jgi:hypothetical protein
MAATLQFISLLGTSSPHPAPSCSSSSTGNEKQQFRSVHLPRQQGRGRRLRAARAVETDAPSANPETAVEPVEPPSVDFAFVSVSSSVLARSVIRSAFFPLPTSD